MKKLRKYVVPVLLCAVLCATAVFAAGDSFDSSTDPVVSLSYIKEIVIPDLEAQIAEALAVAEANSNKASKSELNALADRLSSLQKQLANLNQVVAELKAYIDDEDNKPMSAAWDSVRLTYGQKIFSEKNSFEIVLRTGTAEVISPFSYDNENVEYEQGIIDKTAGGGDLLDGAPIEKNHELLIPVGGDGRGILVTSEDAFILVKGEYIIVD